MKGEVADRLLLAVVEQAHARRLLSEEHFTVDGTLIQAWCNRRSFREKQDPPIAVRGRAGASCCAIRMSRPPIRRPGCSARVRRGLRCRAIWATF